MILQIPTKVIITKRKLKGTRHTATIFTLLILMSMLLIIFLSAFVSVRASLWMLKFYGVWYPILAAVVILLWVVGVSKFRFVGRKCKTTLNYCASSGSITFCLDGVTYAVTLDQLATPVDHNDYFLYGHNKVLLQKNNASVYFHDGARALNIRLYAENCKELALAVKQISENGNKPASHFCTFKNLIDLGFLGKFLFILSSLLFVPLLMGGAFVWQLYAAVMKGISIAEDIVNIFNVIFN